MYAPDLNEAALPENDSLEGVVEDAAGRGVPVETGGRHARGEPFAPVRAYGDLAPPPRMDDIRAVCRERVKAMLGSPHCGSR